MKEIGRQGLCLFISLFIDQKGSLRSTTRHKHLTHLALLPYTETKSMLEQSLRKFKRKRSCSNVDIFRCYLKGVMFALMII